MNLGRVGTERKSGSEPLHAKGTSLGVSLQEFWQWSASDLISNSQRGILAEFLVALALGVDDVVSTEWDAAIDAQIPTSRLRSRLRATSSPGRRRSSP